MNIDEGRVLALNGAMLGEGTFQFEGDEAGIMPQPPNSLVALHHREGHFGTQISLVGNARQDADGLWSGDWPFHALTLHGSVPALDRMLDFPTFRGGGHHARFEYGGENTGFAWLAFDTVFDPERGSRSLLGDARTLTIEVERFSDGLRFSFDAFSDGLKRRDEPAPPMRVRASFTLTLATLALAGSRLWWRAHHSAISDLDGNGNEPGPLGRKLILSPYGGQPYFRGTLELGTDLPDVYRGPWVSVSFHDRKVHIRPQREPRRLPSGFCEGSNSGPELVLYNFAPESWKEMLGDRDEAELIQSGGGIGYSQRVTGRDAGDEGPHIQPITMLRTRIARCSEGLAVSLVGELGPYEAGQGSYPPLGPDFGLDLVVPEAFLFARGVTFGNMWQQRKERLERTESAPGEVGGGQEWAGK